MTLTAPSALATLLGLLLVPPAAQADVPGALPPPPNPRVAVPLHLDRVREHLRSATAADELGRRCLGEANESIASAAQASARGDLSGADQLAASADDLLRAVSGPPAGRPKPPAEDVLGRVDTMAIALALVKTPRAAALLALARDVAANARRAAANGLEAAATVGAMRAEAIARAAAHVAIAADPGLANALPPPPPHRPRPPAPNGPPDPPAAAPETTPGERA